jgi:hypothetical protein
MPKKPKLPLSAAEIEHRRRLEKEEKSRGFHRAANLLAEAAREVGPHDGLLSVELHDRAKACRDAGERALTVDG